MPETLFNSQGEPVRFGQRLGGGSEGVVYEVQGQEDLVAKVYYEMPTAEKAEKLVVLTRLGTERLRGLSAWPIDVLRDQHNGRVAGFVMNRLTQAEEVHTLHSPKSRLQKFPGASWAFLIHVAANFARAVAAIHEHGLVIGDVNPRNALVTRKGTVFLLDCDSFQVSIEGRVFRCEFGVPEYTPPELQETPFREIDRKPEHDCFSLAVVIFQLLFLGRHPFSGRFLGEGEMSLERAIRELRFAYAADAESRQMRRPPGTLALAAISPAIADLFGRVFTSTSADRPKAGDWIAPLDLLGKSLRKCVLHGGHHYYAELSACPWCEIETWARVRLFNLSPYWATGRRGHFRLDEMWNDIEAVPPPTAVSVYRDEILDRLKPSEEAVAFRRRSSRAAAVAVSLSALIGFAAAWIPYIFIILFLTPTGLFLFFWVVVLLESFGLGAVNDWVEDRVRTGSGVVNGWFRRATRSPSLDDPFIKRLEQAKRDAEAEVAKVEERWKREAGDELFFSRLAGLQSYKREYERFAERRAAKLNRVASLSLPAGLEVERELDERRRQLETKLAGGAIFLHRTRQEIEESRRKLFPAAIEARRSLAQAETNLKAASNIGWSKLAVIVLVVAFAAGSAVKYVRGLEAGDRVSAPESRPSDNGDDSWAKQRAEQHKTSRKYYELGVLLMKAGDFGTAAMHFRQANSVYWAGKLVSYDSKNDRDADSNAGAGVEGQVGTGLSAFRTREPLSLGGRVEAGESSLSGDQEERCDAGAGTEDVDEEARRVLKQIDELSAARRDYGSSHLVLGLLYARAGLLEEAEHELRALQKANPDSAIAGQLLRRVRAMRRDRSS
jgi:tetratricopeptide (TPR) repeat protein